MNHHLKAAFIFLLFTISYGNISSQTDITVEDIWRDYKFSAKSVPGFNFMNDGAHYSRLQNNSIERYDLKSGEKIETILNGDDLDIPDNKISAYSFSNDESKILISIDEESIYRRSSKAFCYVYDRKKDNLISVYDDAKISAATFSPDGKYLSYVWENNLYYFSIDNGETVPITEDGIKNEVINGMCDWVYEEEFGFTKAFYWSPDSKKIAFIRFDEAEVQEFTMTNYTGELYPEYETFKYPKVGERNAEVSVHLYDIYTDQLKPLEIGDLEDQYVPRLKWTNNPDYLTVTKMNRHQNHLELHKVNVTNGRSTIIIDEENKYYIDVTDDLYFLEGDKGFIWSSEESGYNHLYHYDFNGTNKKVLTKGEYDITRLYGVDEKNGKAYYQAAQSSPLERQVYELDLNNGKSKILTNKAGTNNAQFSSTFDYFTWSHSRINQPATYAIYDRSGQEVRGLEKNTGLAKVTQGVQPAEFFSVQTRDNLELNGYMIKPKDFSMTQEYPVLMFVYGGPGSQMVMDGWRGQNYWWFQLLAQKGYVVVSVDNRGTGARGEEFKKSTYLTLGKYETLDQIDAAKHLGSLPYIDKDRIGIFGWSYGGFMASHCILQGNDVFDTAIAVAPVTNWKWYDTIYTERFMRTLEENPDGYKKNSPIFYADHLKGSYLLVHGGSDDNVHFQNSAEMAAALIKANKQYDTYFYPNRNHGIYGDNARLHLYTKMTDFILENL